MQTAWEETVKSAGKPLDWTVTDGLLSRFEWEGDAKDDARKKAGAKFCEGEPDFVAGRRGQAAAFDGKRFVDAGDVGGFGYFDKFSCAAWVHPTAPTGTILSRMTPEPKADGYYLQLNRGKLQVNLVKRWLDDAIRVETRRKLPMNRWSHVLVSYDGSRRASGVRVYIDGRREDLDVRLDALNQSFASQEPLRVGAGQSGFHGRLDDVRVYRGVVSPDEAQWIATPESVSEIVAKPRNQRSASQAGKLTACYLHSQAPEEVRQAYLRTLALQAEKQAYWEAIPTTMVMQEMETPRETHVLIRGQYDKPGERVSPGVPASFPPLPSGAPNNRLGLAEWLVSPAQPLTARVAVNRYWQMFFGAGIVRTAEDFGSQGERPSHPQLLDWLATEFMRLKWNIKALQKTIVMSAAYRQSSRVSQQALCADPENRLLAHGPRFRLSAEMIRDQALAVSGLLVEQIGGPSVKPYQPAGLWKEIATDGDYKQALGDGLYRRSLYTYWKRTVGPPMMMAFDASSRETCRVRSARTNTPLQALTLMNDVTFVEASRVLAERMMAEGGVTPGQRIAFGFRLVTSRRPEAEEAKILIQGFQRHAARFQQNSELAKQLVSAGRSPRNPKLDTVELAAYTTIASLLLNLDEAVTKE